MISFKDYCKLDEAIKGWKHAHTDIIKSRAAASAAAKPIQLRRLTSKGVESKMSSTEQSAFSSHEDAQKHVDNMHQMNPGKKFSYNKYVEGKHVGVITKSTNESEELDESGWIGGISKWKEAVNAKHGHALPTFKKVSQPGSPGKSTTYATSSQTGNIIGVYQHHNKSGTVHESVELDEAEGLTTKKNQNGGHDVYHNGTHIGHVEQKSMPWLRGKTIKKVFAKKLNGESVVVDSDDSGKNTIEQAKKTLLRHHLADAHNSNKNR